MDPNESSAHDSNLKRDFDEASTSTGGDEESFNLKKVKREPGTDESEDNVLLHQLKLNRVPEMTPVHYAPCNIKLELKSENGFLGYDSTPTNSECPSPLSPLDMGKSYEKLIEKGRAEFIKVREKIESERAERINSTKSTTGSTSEKDIFSRVASWEPWWSKQKNQAQEKIAKDQEKLAKEQENHFCFRCKRYGHLKPKCRNPFNHRYPQKYLNEHPALREKFREAAIRKRRMMNNQGNEFLPFLPHHQRPKNSNFHYNDNSAYPVNNNAQLSANSLQLNQIAEVLNQILQNQMIMMNGHRTKISYEDLDFKPTNYKNHDNKPWNNNQSKKPGNNYRPLTFKVNRF